MENRSTKSLFLFAIFILFSLRVLAQTITVGTVDAGPYGQGSTIAVPINVNDASGCIDQSNTFKVYLSDASGNFPAGGTLIGSYSGFYAPFVNGVIPSGTPAGTGYKIRVQSTSPAVTSSTSATFKINGSAAVTASVSSSTINGSSPEVFGRCIGLNNAPFVIANTSAPGTTVTASFFNEQTQAFEGTNVPIPAGGYTFTAKTSNYTVIVKTVDASGTVGTHNYQLVNNLIRSNIGSTGNGFVCLVNGKGDLSFNIDISSLAGGIQVNYPGNTYTLDWGDGTSTVYTFCQLKALNGIVTHTFTLPSCGKTGNGVVNAFYVSNQPQSPYCGQISAPPGVSAKVIIVPITSFTAPSVACAGSAITIPNTSQPGPDPNNTVSATCDNDPGTLYDWFLDGVPVPGYQGVPLATSFILPATTPAGTHTLLLHTELGGGYCPSTDYVQTICLEHPPQPAFTIPNEVCITAGPVTPTNTSVTDATCSVAQYNWTVTGPAPVTYTGGTDANSKIPKFVFTAPGIYQVQLGVTSSGCGQVLAPLQTILIDAAPAASLAPDATICGTNVTLTFSNTQTTTKTTFSGTAQTQPTTYTWTITGGAYSFAGGTNANSQYPKILFKDFATYTITVTHQNSCGTVTDTQKLTFAQAPIVDAGPDQTVCASSPATTLAGSVTGAYTGYQWVGGNGTFSPSRNVLNPTYTPSASEVTAGNVTLTLQANAALPAPCNLVTNAVVINITPTPIITSPPTANVCSGQPLNYTITANYPATTFTWTAALTSGTATGFAATGSGSTINDIITNTSTADAVVTYTVTPKLNGCTGPASTVTVSVHPLPVMTAVPVNSPNCNSQPANIKLTSNIGNTSYTWTSTGSGVTGNTTQSTPLLTNSIQDILVNSGSTPVTVTYTITPYNGTCPGTPVTASVIIEPSPKASNAGPDKELCNVTSYTLQGNDPSPGTGMWTKVQGPAGVSFSDPTNKNAVVSGLIPGNTYQFQWTITGYPSCPSNSSVVNITIDKPPVGGTTAGAVTVCSGSNVGQVTLSGQLGTVVRWESSLDNGSTWQPIVNTGTTQSYLNLTQTTQYRAIVQNGPVCGQVPSSPTTITVSPLTVPSDPGPDDKVCGVTSYTLQGNNPAPGTGKWTVVSGPAGATFSNDTDPNAVVSNLTPGNVYKFKWTITGSGTCPATSNVVTITIEKAPVGGVTASDATVCSGSNNGQISLSGQFGTIVRWESSIDGSSWQPIVNNGTTQTYLNLTQTTQYRAILHNGTTCNDVPSTATTITVVQPPIAAVAGPDDKVCSVITYTLNGNNPAPYSGKWTVASGPAGVVFADDTKANTTVSGLIPGNVYQFKWTITSSASCPSTSDVVNITIEKAPVGGTATANPSIVCMGSNSGLITLTGQFGTVVRWELSTDNWASSQPITNTGTTQSFLNLVQTTQYRAILHNGTTCSDVPSSPATVTVEPPPVVAVAGPNDVVCSVTTYTLQGNSPAPGTGKWTVVSGPAGATFSDDTKPNTTVSNLIPGSVYQFKWTITGSATCPPSSSVVNITIEKAPVGGTTASDATVCSGSNNGQITLTGHFGRIVRWESSTDNGASWQPIANNGTIQTYMNLTQTTQYRAMLHNGSVCSDVPSTVTTITVGELPIASIPGPNDEVCNVTTYTLHGNSPLPGTGKWTVASGPAGATFSNDADPNAVVSGLIPGSIYQFKWTITGSPSCPPNSNIVTITIDKAPVGGNATANPTTVCAGSNNGQVTLAGQFGTILRWESSVDNGATWQPVNNVAPTLSYTNLTQTTQYRAILHNGDICGNVSSSVAIITVEPPPIASLPGQDEEICNVTTYTLHGNNPAPGTGKWTVVSGPSGAVFSDDTKPNAVVSGLIPGNVYQFRWTITGSASCPPNSDVVNITIDKAPVGGTTSSDATVCAGDNNGRISLTGYFGRIVRWESSVDGITWKPIDNASAVQAYVNLTQTTSYRAILQTTGLCGEAPSSITTITVNPQTVIADAGKDYNICNQTSITLNGNDPSPFKGMWTQTAGPAVTIVNPTNHETLVTGLAKGNVYTFQWTIKGLAPCPDTKSSITIGAYADVIPSFTMTPDHGCGPVTVKFVNTSTPAPTGEFRWDFGDGTPVVIAVTPPPHTFKPAADGREISYKITLTPTSNCNVQEPYVDYLKVNPLVPVAKLLPNQTSACGAFNLIAKNLSPGGNAQYDFYLKDAKGTVVQHLTYSDTRDAVFSQINPTVAADYTVYVVVTDKCGNQSTSVPIGISLAPSSLVSLLQIKGNVNSVCLGSPVTFQNLSSGGDSFTISIFDADKHNILTIPAGTGDLNYTPTTTGTYYVSITAGNEGCGNAPASALKQFVVFPTPDPAFNYKADQDYTVVFNNTTPDAGKIPASSLTYKWDFGDGTTDNSFNPRAHHFDFSKSPFTVTLTATTPGTECLAVVQQTINVQFKGNLFLPNAFVPASSNKELNVFRAKGSGMKTWKMQIFNNFGQLVWETTRLDSNGSPVDGWDGTYKGQIVQQGVYIWQISATLLNGEEWKGMSYNNSSPSRTGPVHLIR